MRLSQARAELAVAREAWGEAVEAATHVIDQSRSRHRPSTEALALITRARAARRLGARSAPEDARAAVDVGRRLGDPAVLLDCLIVLLELDGTDDLLEETRRTVQKIVRAVSDERLHPRSSRQSATKRLALVGHVFDVSSKRITSNAMGPAG